MCTCLVTCMLMWVKYKPQLSHQDLSGASLCSTLNNIFKPERLLLNQPRVKILFYFNNFLRDVINLY